MKKGFILALLMVAMVAVVVPVSAKAPIIGTLPTIIIGDNDDASGGKGIMRFWHAVNLGDKAVVNWNNDDGYTSDLFHAYIFNTQATPDVVAYNPNRIIDTLTAAQSTALLATGNPTGLEAYRVTSSTAGGFWLSLFDATRHPAITNPYAATPAVDGKTIDTYTAETVLHLIAGVTSSTTKLVLAEAKPFTVMCKSGQNDSLQANYLFNYGFENTLDGWTYSNAAGFNTVGRYPAVGATVYTGIGFDAANVGTSVSGKPGVAAWSSPSTLAGNAATASSIYKATAVLKATAATYAASPGWRLFYYNQGFAHYGYLWSEKAAGNYKGEVNLPIAGSNFTAKVYWAVPTTLSDMGDTGYLATGMTFPGSTSQDGRAYKIDWGVIARTGETGILSMESILIQQLAKPARVTALQAWGTSKKALGTGTAFNAGLAGKGWTEDTGAITIPGVTVVRGKVTLGAATMALDLTNGAKPNIRYTSCSAGNTGVLNPVANTLYRLTTEVSCASQNAAPGFRLIAQGFYTDNATFTYQYKDTLWGEEWGRGTVAKYPLFKSAAQTVAPCVPSGDANNPSTVELYMFSHNVNPAAAANSSVLPIFSLLDEAQYGNTFWPDPVGIVTVNYMSWENLGTGI